MVGGEVVEIGSGGDFWFLGHRIRTEYNPRMALVPIPFTPSRNIAAIEYDADEQLLIVSFHSGAVYHYLGVPGDVADGFGQALSSSQYLSLYVTNQFIYEKIG